MIDHMQMAVIIVNTSMIVLLAIGRGNLWVKLVPKGHEPKTSVNKQDCGRPHKLHLKSQVRVGLSPNKRSTDEHFIL